METDTKNYIPDTSHAKKWITDDTYIVDGMIFKILPNFEVVHVPRNNRRKRGKHGDK